eukprot:scaffold1803_cov92-Amphora_coffeaeformis.AAC.69
MKSKVYHTIPYHTIARPTNYSGDTNHQTPTKLSVSSAPVSLRFWRITCSYHINPVAHFFSNSPLYMYVSIGWFCGCHHKPQRATMVEQHSKNPLVSAASCTILALYKFISPKWDESYVKNLRVELETFLRKHQVFGNLLLGTEGINGTVCYELSNKIINQEHTDDNQSDDPIHEYFSKKFPGIRLRLSYNDKPVFHRLKIRIKKEIVTLGVENDDQFQVDPCHKVGVYVPPGPEWHALLQDPNTLVIDTRNNYEVQLGTFQNAVNPETTAFTEFPTWFRQQLKNKPTKIAMFCTGGIRCEKATSLCLSHPTVVDAGIPVYHLEGGILAYLSAIPESESLWQGECFVFDQRTAVRHGLKPSTQYTLCHACRHPLGPADRASPEFQEGIACPYCVHQQDKEQRRQRYQERQKQCELSEHTSIPHIHDGKLVKALTQTN